MRFYRKSLLFLAAIVLFSCGSTKKISEVPVIIEEELLDTMVVTAPPIDDSVEENFELPVYNPSYTRKFDLLHTKLDLSFDWEKQHVLGLAEITLSPVFYPQDELVLDARVFDIHSIALAGTGQELKYFYDGAQLRIGLDRQYTKDEDVHIAIDYTAKPNEGPSGGSMAILSNKGLFFIDPKDEDPEKPTQIWTQGETENNSRWFPTIDKPNMKTTQEIRLTVENKFKTLSNGRLVSSVKNPDGTRTDHWKQDKPHAPYLFFIGIGEYAVVQDSWNSIPVDYYVEPEFEAHARKIFNHTPEMLSFFSDILNFPYPWDKYSQIVCRDYVSGAMENTGAVIFGEFVQKTSRELLDNNNDDIVAHEMFHHWFGDLVTCESWSNLTLNEGFATYGELLWQEYKYGAEAMERKRLQKMNAYLMSAAQQGTHDLIDFEYGNKENMFDAHSYSKGGLIVHMLRSYVGDDAFFAALNKYLTDHQYTDVESHELRLAFEEVTGEDLNWFFNQWFFDKGHPVLNVEYNINADNSTVEISVEQTQDAERNAPIFQLPVDIALYYASGERVLRKVWIYKRKQKIDLVYEGPPPVAVVLDGKHNLLAVVNEKRTDEEQLVLYRLSDEYLDKVGALEQLSDNAEGLEIFRDALGHAAQAIRLAALENADRSLLEKDISLRALNDPYSGIRSLALGILKNVEIARKLVQKDPSYAVIGTALDIIAGNDLNEALELAENLKMDYHKPILPEMANIYAATGDEKYLDFFGNNINDVSLFGFFNFMNKYMKLAYTASVEGKIKTAGVLKEIASQPNANYYKTYTALNNIKNLMTTLEKTASADEKAKEGAALLRSYITEVLSKTTDKRLINAFGNLITP